MDAAVVSMVEKGWGGARRVSIELTKQGITVHHFVRGRLPDDLIAALTPYAGMRITGWPVRWFRPGMWALLLWRKVAGKPPVVLVDNERAETWVKRWRFSRAPVLVLEGQDGRPLLRVGGHSMDLTAVRGLLEEDVKRG